MVAGGDTVVVVPSIRSVQTPAIATASPKRASGLVGSALTACWNSASALSSDCVVVVCVPDAIPLRAARPEVSGSTALAPPPPPPPQPQIVSAPQSDKDATTA